MKAPKPRIKRVFEKTLENGGNVTKAMRELKYSENTINNPINVTGTKSWEQLLEENIPESLITETHKDAFTANKTVSATNTSREADSKTNDFVDVPDWQTRMKAVELGYKVRGKMVEKTDLTSGGEILKGIVILPSLNDK